MRKRKQIDLFCWMLRIKGEESMNIKEFYDSIKVDPENVYHRFGNNELLLAKFLKKFLNDTTFLQLTEAIEKNDLEAIFRTAHTLKGLCGNFDFKELYEYSSKIVECYRAEEYDSISSWYEKLKVCYADTTTKLAVYLD